MAFDDAWIEAELERQLQEMPPVSDGESEPDNEAIAHSSPVEDLPLIETASDEPLPVDALPPSFQEMLRCLQDWETSITATTEDAKRELQEAAEDAEQEMQKAIAAPKFEDLDTEDSQATDDQTIVLKFSKIWVRMSLRLVSASEVDKGHDQEAGCPGETSQNGNACSVQDAVIEQTPSTSPPKESGVDDPTPCPLEAVAATASTSPPCEVTFAVEEEQRRVEAERLASLAALEKDRVARLKRMMEEEEQRRCEQERCREENAMYSEELRLREYYEYERSCLRREWRNMAWEDRHGSQVRIEERKAEELECERLIREQSDLEASERRAMAREDEIAFRIREYEWQKREKHYMAMADSASFALRDEVRRETEMSRLAQADLESQRWRQLLLAERELHRMRHEDEQSKLMRHSCIMSGPSNSRWKNTTMGGHVSEPLLIAVKPEEALSSMMQPPRVSRKAAAPSNPTKSASAEQSQHGGINASAIASSEPVIDPWGALSKPAHGLAGSQGRRPSARSCALSSTSTASDEKGAIREDGRVYLCSSRLCISLHEGIEQWQRSLMSKAVPWRRPPGPTARPTTSDIMFHKSDLCTSPSSSSTSKAIGGEGGGDDTFGDDELLIDDAAIKFEIREERIERIPCLSSAPQLRMLNLTGNRLRSLEPLCNCPLLEELALCQNLLPSLCGLRHLHRLVVLRATANKIVDASDIAHLPHLRDVNLSMNLMETVQWQTTSLAKLALYGNALVSITFLQHLPSLTYLDIGRNKLTSIDSRLSEWNPLLIKLHFYENHISFVPELRLPLLTDLVFNKNCLEALGPLGLLPSLECLQAKYNKIKSLALPVAASPLLRTLALTDNCLSSEASLQAVFAFPRMTHLDLLENPVTTELMERYRPWVSQHAPHLLELDNDPFTEDERFTAAGIQANESPYVPYQMHGYRAAAPSSSSSAPSRGSRRQKVSRDTGLLGLVDLSKKCDEADWDELGHEQAVAARIVVDTAAASSSSSSAEIVQVRQKNALRCWQHAFKGDESCYITGGCQACALALWCESLRSSRTVRMTAYLRDERIARGGHKASRDESLLVLRRRREFWDSFIEACSGDFEELLRWRGGVPQVCRLAAFELLGAERSKQGVVRRIQARWRGIQARRRCLLLRTQRICESISRDDICRFMRMQAICRGVSARQRLRCAGMRLPQDVRRECSVAECQAAATRLQTAFRCLWARRTVRQKRDELQQRHRKLQWAREVSKLEDEDDDMAPIDVDQFLGGFDAETLGAANPFAVRVPEAQTARRSTAGQHGTATTPTVAPCPGGTRSRKAPAPLMAWSTPPGTADGKGETNSSVGSPASHAGDGLPRRSQSLSSTGESAITESEGFRGGPIQRIQDEWNLQDPRTAKAIYDARRKREKPPGIPKLSHPSQSTAPGVRGAVSRGGTLGGRGAASGRGVGTGRRGTQPLGANDKPILKAQDQIAAFMAMQAQESTGRLSPDPEALEFSSGAPNRRLLRSAMQSPPNSSPSPRIRSPLRLSTP